MAQVPDPNEPFWGHWVRRDDYGYDPPPPPPTTTTTTTTKTPPAKAKTPAPQVAAEPRQRLAWLSSRWFGGCVAAGAALGLALGIWARLTPGPARFVPTVNTVTPPASTVTSTVTRRAVHVVTQPAPAPQTVTEWASATPRPPATPTAPAPGVTVTVNVTTTVTVTVPPSGSP
jgi:hypothetical protein